MSMSSTTSTNRGAPSLLLSIPIECRHIVYKNVAAGRKVKPRDTLRYWFEKQDIQEQIAENLSNDPDANVTYVAGYNDRYDEEDEPEEDEPEEDEPEEDEPEAEDGQEVAAVDQPNDEDEDDDDEEQDGEGDGDDGDEQEGEDEDSHEENIVNDQDVVQQPTATTDIAQGSNTAMATTAVDATQAHSPNIEADGNQVPQDDEGTADADMADSQEEGEDEDKDAAQDPEDERAEVNADMPNADGDEITASPQVIVVKPHPKWRHVPKFMRLTQCPPEMNLFLISKQLNSEVRAWFYDIATLRIDATASFLHFSFFELALTKLAEAPFSPMENIKKAEITFVWDTTWVRAEESGFAGAVFPVFLKNRIDFILEILLRAPELENVLIHWHDSAEDDRAKQLRADTVEPFIMNLKAKVDIKDHYITPDTKPRAKSRAGKQRLEFKAIIDNGCETF